MANVKITDLTALTSPETTDVLPIVDVDTDVTKKVSVGEIVGKISGDVTVGTDGTAAITGGVIVNADVNASAAIAGTKIDPDFGSQTVETTGVFSAAGGAEATPSIAFTGDLNTGIYSPGADQLAISSNGVGRLFIDSSGNVGVGTASPNALLHLVSSNPAIRFTDTDSGEPDHLISGSGGTLYLGVDENNEVANSTFRVAIDGSERLRIDSDGRLLVGTSTAFTMPDGEAGLQRSAQITLASNTFAGGIQSNSFFNAATPNGAGAYEFTKSNSTTIGAHAIVSDDDVLGSIQWAGSDGANYIRAARIRAEVDGTPGTDDMPGRLVFSTTADGASSPTQALYLSSDKRVYLSTTWYNNHTTANAANVYAVSNGELYRSTSSIKYKTNVETLQDSYADAILNIRPVWYRSTCAGDNPDWGWWGFIAEEVAAIDPRLVQWKTKEVVYDDNGSPVETPCDPEPEGIAYDRFVPHLLNLIKRQGEAIAELQAEVAALKGA